MFHCYILLNLFIIITHFYTVIAFQVFLSDTNNCQTDLIDRILKIITTQGQSGPGSNGNEGGTLHSSEPQNWSLTTRCSFGVISGTFLEDGGGEISP